jgi:7-cyano-7-deazaguanine synthase
MWAHDETRRDGGALAVLREGRLMEMPLAHVGVGVGCAQDDVPHDTPQQCLGIRQCHSHDNMTPTKKAVILFSGGLDSTTILAEAQATGYEAHCLSFDYGQRHQHELLAATNLAKKMSAKTHKIIRLDLRAFGGSALTSDSIEVPKNRDESEMSAEIPVTYVPARNTIFLSYALAFAEVIKANAIFIGVNAVDYSGYPDCRPEYIAAFEAMARLATKAGVEGGDKLQILTPLIHLSKVEIIQMGLKRNVDYADTHSCYDPTTPLGHPCEHCDSCLLRISAFGKLGMLDPAIQKHKKGQ